MTDQSPEVQADMIRLETRMADVTRSVIAFINGPGRCTPQAGASLLQSLEWVYSEKRTDIEGGH